MVRGREVPPARIARCVPAPDAGSQPPECAKCTNSVIEFSTEAREDPNEGREFGDMPVHCICPHCERTIITFLDREASYVTWLLSAVVWFSLGWMSLWVLPLLWPAFKDVVHHCPRCLNAIARKSRISLPEFRSEVMTVKVGSCAIVLARKYVMILAGLLAVIGGVFVLRSTVNLKQMGKANAAIPPKGPMSNLTWADYMTYCGPRTSLRHRNSLTRHFEAKFRGRTFRWQGEVLAIREGFQVLFMRTRSVVMIRMYPQRFQRHDLPDLALLFGEERYDEVATLEPGSWVDFEATILSHGYRGDPEVMMLYHVALAERPSILDSSSFALGNGSATLGGATAGNSTMALKAVEKKPPSNGEVSAENATASETDSQMLPENTTAGKIDSQRQPAGGPALSVREQKSEAAV